MVAVVGWCAVVVTVLSNAGVEAQSRTQISHDTALASTPSTPSTGAAHWQREVTSTMAKDDDFLKTFTSMVKDGLTVAGNLLDFAKWPLDVALSLHSTALTQIGSFISWFNFLVSFVTPGGMGNAFLAWLRGDPGNMSPRGPLRWSRFHKVKMEF